VVYLITPVKSLPPLTNSVKSLEPGDTVQLKNVEGFYTNQSRTEVMNFYRSQIDDFFYFRLNHPPEKAKEIIKDTIQSYYLEEYIIPFKQSIFVNGYEWENDVFTKPEKRIKNKLFYENKEYRSKITIKTFTPKNWQKIVALITTEVGLYAIYRLLKSTIKHD